MALSLQRYAIYRNCNNPYRSLLKERCRIERERSRLLAMKPIDHLPENLIFEVLSWLPVKDLLQFKTVSKSWYAIISSPTFISKHLKNYYANNDDWRGCLLDIHYMTPGELLLLALFVDETPRVLAKEDISGPPYGSCVYGPSNGLYYAYEYEYSYRGLWNPAINQLHRLPNIISKPDFPPRFIYAKNEVYGFGLDPLTGDYKVVVIKGYWPATDDNDDDYYVDLPPSVLVYSLSTDSWRYCGDLDNYYILDNNKCYIYVNGRCYWFGVKDCSFGMIISFDFATDSYEEIHVPDYPTDSYRECILPYYCQPSSKCLGVCDGSLAFLCFHQNEMILDIWIWRDEDSWAKILSVGPYPDVRGPIGHWKGNWFILQRIDNGLVLFDFETQQVQDLGFQTHRWCEGVFAYVESLVSIKDLIKCKRPEEFERA